MSHWGGQFQDAAQRLVTTPGVAAFLRLEDPVLVGPAFQLVTLRARVVGIAGNLIQVKFLDDGEAETGFVEETGNQCTIRFWGGVTTAADLFAQINVNSTLVEAIGPFDPTAVFENGDDETGFIFLEGGAPESSFVVGHWGHHFPEDDGEDLPPVVAPETAASFLLQLEGGTKVTYSWETDIFTAEMGAEWRASPPDDPQLKIEGTITLLGDQRLELRTVLERFAATGAPFSLALPFEQTTLSGDADDVTIPIDDTASIDWAVPGTRVAIIGAGDATAEGVIQRVAAGSVTLDVPPGALAIEGARIMPMMPVVLDAEQGFDRYRVEADTWAVSAKAAQFGFPGAGVPGELDLGAVTSSGVFAAAFLRARVAGSQSIEVSIQADSLDGVTLDESFDPVDGSGELIIHVEDNGSTMAELASAINGGSLLVTMLGTWTDSDIISTGDDEFIPTDLTGGVAKADAVYGRGAVPKVYTDLESGDVRLIWDPPIEQGDTLAEQIHALTEPLDLPGVPTVVGVAPTPDWGRTIATSGDIRSLPWQYLMFFLSSLKGSWKSFWLPTWRADLVCTEDATPTELTIDNAIGDFALWSSRGYKMLRVDQDGDVSYVLITASLDNGDGTTTLTIEPSGSDPAPNAAPVTMLSWLELVRLDVPDVVVTFQDAQFFTDFAARVVQQ